MTTSSLSSEATSTTPETNSNSSGGTTIATGAVTETFGTIPQQFVWDGDEEAGSQGGNSIDFLPELMPKNWTECQIHR